jgi:hypothetical protein
MEYKEAQAKAKTASRICRVRWDGGTLNLGIRQFKRKHRHLADSHISDFKARSWAEVDKFQRQSQ